VITVEIEKAGIPTAHVTTMTPVALMIGSNRIIVGNGIVHPLGDVKLSGEAEKELRRAIVRKALDSLQVDVTSQRVF
jgi:glycine reductase complex component B subunit gamma